MDEVFEIIKAGPGDTPPEQALYRIQQTYSDGSGGRLNVDWDGLLRLHELIHDRIALEGRVCETCGTKGCPRPATGTTAWVLVPRSWVEKRVKIVRIEP